MQFERLIYDEVDSTNSEAARLVASGKITSPSMIFAHRQTAGRGTRCREWQSTQGNLKVSYVFPVDVPLRHLPKLVYPIALCVREVLACYLSGRAVKIKWPNDILVEGKKVSGSLHETASADGVSYFIAGIGVNLAWHPDGGVMYEATSLSELVQTPSEPMEFADHIGQQMERRVLGWKPEHFQQDKEDFLKHCFALGEEVTISTTKDRRDRVTGEFLGLSDNGSIRVRTASGTVEFSSGDIFPNLGGRL
ncbi:MAG: biotin--[acetyl-CoA-carboxylase] ligase [Pseudomonadota bacterium]